MKGSRDFEGQTSQLKSCREEEGRVIDRPHTGPQRSRQKQLSEPCSRSMCLMRRITLPRGGLAVVLGRCAHKQTGITINRAD